MDATVVHEAAAATLAGTLPFPQIVAKLIGAGVEYYHVDYAGACKRFYDANGTCVVTPIPYEGLPAVAAELDVEALRDDIRDSQQNGQHYRDFTVRAMRAGVQGHHNSRKRLVSIAGLLWFSPSQGLTTVCVRACVCWCSVLLYQKFDKAS